MKAATSGSKKNHGDFRRADTVCFISTVTFHDGVAPKVIKIIQFCKEHLEDNTLAFCYQ